MRPSSFLFFLALWAVAGQATAQSTAPITTLIIGQSNAQGSGNGDSLLTVNLTPAVAQEWLWQPSAAGPNYGTGYFTQGLRDPMARTSINNMRSHTASLVPAFVNRLNALTGRRVLVAHHAVGGTRMYARSGTTTYWRPDSPNMLNSVRKVRGMMRLPTVPDSLDWLIISLGESDGTTLGTRPTTYAMFPDSLVVDSAVDVGGNLVSYPAPRGYPNPAKLQNVYDNYRALLQYYRNEFGSRLGIVMIQTGEWGHANPSMRSGVTQMKWIQRKLAKDQAAAGERFWLLRGTETFCERGWLNDEVHYSPAGLNYLGNKVAEKAHANLIR